MTQAQPKPQGAVQDFSPWFPEAEEYVSDFAQGVTFGRHFLLYPSAQTRVSSDGERLYIGRPGAEGIEFALRRGVPGVWAYYPIDAELRELAATVADLVAAGATNSLRL